MFSKGSKVELTYDAIENYGEEWEAVTLIVAHVATAYMPSKEFFANGMPEGFHPGYDEGIGQPLYDLETEDGEEVPFSVYEYELEKA